MLRQGVTKRGEAINAPGSHLTYTSRSSQQQRQHQLEQAVEHKPQEEQSHSSSSSRINFSPAADYRSLSAGRTSSNSTLNSRSTVGASTAGGSSSIALLSKARARARARTRSRPLSRSATSGSNSGSNSGGNTTHPSSSSNLAASLFASASHLSSATARRGKSVTSNIRRGMRTVSPSPGPGGRSVSVGHHGKSALAGGGSGRYLHLNPPSNGGDPEGVDPPTRAHHHSLLGRAGGGAGTGKSGSKSRSQSQPPKSQVLGSGNSKSLSSLYGNLSNNNNNIMSDNGDANDSNGNGRSGTSKSPSRLNASLQEGLIHRSDGGGNSSSRRTSKTKKGLSSSTKDMRSLSPGNNNNNPHHHKLASSLNDVHNAKFSRKTGKDKTGNPHDNIHYHSVGPGGLSHSYTSDLAASMNSNPNSNPNSNLHTSATSSSSTRQKKKKDPKPSSSSSHHRSLSPNHHLFSLKGGRFFGGNHHKSNQTSGHGGQPPASKSRSGRNLMTMRNTVDFDPPAARGVSIGRVEGISSRDDIHDNNNNHNGSGRQRSSSSTRKKLQEAAGTSSSSSPWHLHDIDEHETHRHSSHYDRDKSRPSSSSRGHDPLPSTGQTPSYNRTGSDHSSDKSEDVMVAAASREAPRLSSKKKVFLRSAIRKLTRMGGNGAAGPSSSSSSGNRRSRRGLGDNSHSYTSTTDSNSTTNTVVDSPLGTMRDGYGAMSKLSRVDSNGDQENIDDDDDDCKTVSDHGGDRHNNANNEEDDKFEYDETIKPKRGWGLGGAGNNNDDPTSSRGRSVGRSRSSSVTKTAKPKLKSYSTPRKIQSDSKMHGLEPEEVHAASGPATPNDSSGGGSNFARRSRSLLSKKPNLFGSGEKSLSRRKNKGGEPLSSPSQQQQLQQQQREQQEIYLQQQRQQQHQVFLQQQQKQQQREMEKERERELERERHHRGTSVDTSSKQFSSSFKSSGKMTTVEESDDRRLRSNSVPHHSLKLSVTKIQEEHSSDSDEDSSDSSQIHQHQYQQQQQQQQQQTHHQHQHHHRHKAKKPSKTKINCIICRQRLHAGEYIEFSNLYFCNDSHGRSSCFKCARCRCQLDALLLAKRDDLDANAGAILDGTQVISNARGSVIQCGKCTNYVSSLLDERSKASSKASSKSASSSRESSRDRTKRSDTKPVEERGTSKSSPTRAIPQDRNESSHCPLEAANETPVQPPLIQAREEQAPEESATQAAFREESAPALKAKGTLPQRHPLHAYDDPGPQLDDDDDEDVDGDTVRTSDSQVATEDGSIPKSETQSEPEYDDDNEHMKDDDAAAAGVQLTCALCSKDFSDYKGEIQVVGMNNYHAECLRRVGGNLAKNIRTTNEITPAEAVRSLAKDVTVKLSLKNFSRSAGEEDANNSLCSLFFTWKDKEKDTVAWKEHEKEQLMLQFLRNDDSVVELGLQVVYDLDPDAFGNPNYEGFFSNSGLEGQNISCRKTSIILPEKLEMSDEGIISRRLNVDLKLSNERNTGYLLCSDHVAISLEPFPTNDDPVEKVLRAVWNLEEDGIMHEFTFSVPFINTTNRTPFWGVNEGEVLDLTQAQFDAYVDQIEVEEDEPKEEIPIPSLRRSISASLNSGGGDECDWELRAGELMGEMGMSDVFDAGASWLQQDFDFYSSDIAIAPPTPKSEERTTQDDKGNNNNNTLSMVTLPSIIFVTVRKQEAGDDLGLTLIEKSNAIIVDAISSSGKFANTDLKVGCEILSINGHRIRNPQSFYRMTKDAVGKIVIKASIGNSPPGTLYRVVKKKHMVVLGRKSDLSNTVNELGISFELTDGLIRVKEVSEYFSESISKGDICLSIDGEVCHSLRKTVNSFSLANGAVALLIFPMLDMWKGMAELMVDKKYSREWHGAECELLEEGGDSPAISLKVDEKTGLCSIEGDEMNNINVSNMNSMIKQVLGVLKDAIQASRPLSRGNSTKTSSLSPDSTRYSASTAGKAIKNQSDVYKRAVAKLEKMREDGLLSSKDYDAAMKTFKG